MSPSSVVGRHVLVCVDEVAVAAEVAGVALADEVAGVALADEVAEVAEADEVAEVALADEVAVLALALVASMALPRRRVWNTRSPSGPPRVDVALSLDKAFVAFIATTRPTKGSRLAAHPS